jgi:RNase adapter protein RapZ
MASKRIVVISGMAGAGKSTAARALEDLGFFVIDNLPPQLIETLLNLSDTSGGELRRIALVIDAREASFLREFGPTWDRLQRTGHDISLVFLDCTDDVLVRRFKETRRRHPLDAGLGVIDGIARERLLLRELSDRADEVIPTQGMSVHDLKRRIQDRFAAEHGQVGQVLTLMSFGFKHGLPPELDLCFDVRFLPNPYFVEGLRPLTGLDEPVATFVLGQNDAGPFLDKVTDLVSYLLPRYAHEGKAYVTVAIGCTGGRHRSVALAEVLGRRLRAAGQKARVTHRDADKAL